MIQPLTVDQEMKLNASLAASAHALVTARAKHRRAVDSTVALLSSALETIEADQQTEFSEYIHACVKIAISDLLKSKPESGAWT
jgi:hypothetical protein